MDNSDSTYISIILLTFQRKSTFDGENYILAHQQIHTNWTSMKITHSQENVHLNVPTDYLIYTFDYDYCY